MTKMLLLASLETTLLLAPQAIQMGRWNFCGWNVCFFQRATRVKAKLAVVRQRISVFIYRLCFKYWEVCSFEHGLVAGNVARSQSSLFYHSTRPPGERLVVFLGVNLWHNSDYSRVWGPKGLAYVRRIARGDLHKRDLDKPDLSEPQMHQMPSRFEV